MRTMAAALAAIAVSLSGIAAAAAAERQLLWGDTHLHTTYSFDAFLNNNLTADPDTAYRFAKGQPVIHPYHRARMQLAAPLDFLVVSDHAEFLGRLRDIYHNGLQEEDAGLWDSVVNWYVTRTIRNAIDAREGAPLFRQVLPFSTDPRVAAGTPRDIAGGTIPPDPEVERSAWTEIVATAQAHYEPGRFTTLLGWEWSSLPGGANLHRVVVTDADSDQARSFQPVAVGIGDHHAMPTATRRVPSSRFPPWRAPIPMICGDGWTRPAPPPAPVSWPYPTIPISPRA